MKRLVAIVAVALACQITLAGDGIEDVLDLVRAVERTTVQVDIDDMPLAVAVDELASSSGLAVQADWEVLLQIGVRPRDVVTLRTSGVSLATALADLFTRIGDEFNRPVWEIHEGRVVITTLRGTEPMRLTDVYDVRDILGDALAQDMLRSEAAPSDGEAAEGKPLSPAAALVHLITDHVDPEGWIRYGGTRDRIDEKGGRLILSAAPRTHRRVRQILHSLRWTNPRGLLLEAAIIDVPSADVVALERAHDPGTASLVRALTRQDSATKLWASTLTGRPGKPVAVAARSGETVLELELKPTFDASVGELVFAVDVTSTTPGGAGSAPDHRSVRTSAHVPTQNGALIVELPAATPGDIRRLLVVKVERR